MGILCGFIVFPTTEEIDNDPTIKVYKNIGIVAVATIILIGLSFSFKG